jgi:fatty-acyl-CoA synthase
MQSNHFRTLLRERLIGASGRPQLRVLVSRDTDGMRELSGPDLLAKSIEISERHCQASPGSVVLLLLPHSEELFLLHLGLVLTGRLPAILPWPTNRVEPRKYQRNLAHQLRNLPAAQLLTLPRLAQNLDPGLPFRVTGCSIRDCETFEALFSTKLEFARVTKHEHVPESRIPEDALFLQFSGGTTGEQKCIVVTATMLANQLEVLGSTLQFTGKDGVVSWLPLYHDMGLIACLWLPVWYGAPSIQFAASDWLMRPGLLFDFLATYGATFCWLPNFAFAYLAAQSRRINGGWDLGHVRAFINCSEPVRQRSYEAFIDAFRCHNVRSDQCQASYAMAENVFAVTQSPLGERPRTVLRTSIQTGRSKTSDPSYDLLDEYYVSSGAPIAGNSVRIRDSNGCLCGDNTPGAIEILSGSLFRGYWGKHGFLTNSFSEDLWYSTGDYGFLQHGHLYVIGRTKDIIIVGGVNFFPEDIESLVNTVRGIYPGRVVAFGVDDEVQGTETLAIVAEMRGEFSSAAATALEHKIRRLITSVLGIAARFVRVTPERWIVKSTAGKISRRETRMRFLEERLDHETPLRMDA